MNGGPERNGYAYGAWHVEDRLDGFVVGRLEPWDWGGVDRQEEFRREAERRATIRRSRRSRIDWRRSGGFAILNPTFTLDELGPRALSAWLIRSDRGKGGFPIAAPVFRRRRRRPRPRVERRPEIQGGGSREARRPR